MSVVAHAPGRVNLIGDHTDYTGGLVFPMAIDLGTTVELEPGGDFVELSSDAEQERAVVPVAIEDPTALEPAWARYVAGVVAEVGPDRGGVGSVRTTLPVGAGLSSSAALELSVALALGFAGTPLELAQLCQRAEHRASGVPSGIMDQLASASGVEGHALLIDCGTLEVDPVAMPVGAAVLVVHSGESRALVGTAYADRRAQCEAAAALVGPLRAATEADLEAIEDDVIRRRARHVVTENARVMAFADALEGSDLAAAGALMNASHRSLRDDFEVSTPVLEATVSRLRSTPGVLGARLTGAGFGGCAVALARVGTEFEGAWEVQPAGGAAVESV